MEEALLARSAPTASRPCAAGALLVPRAGGAAGRGPQDRQRRHESVLWVGASSPPLPLRPPAPLALRPVRCTSGGSKQRPTTDQQPQAPSTSTSGGSAVRGAPLRPCPKPLEALRRLVVDSLPPPPGSGSPGCACRSHAVPTGLLLLPIHPPQPRRLPCRHAHPPAGAALGPGADGLQRGANGGAGSCDLPPSPPPPSLWLGPPAAARPGPAGSLDRPAAMRSGWPRDAGGMLRPPEHRLAPDAMQGAPAPAGGVREPTGILHRRRPPPPLAPAQPHPAPAGGLPQGAGPRGVLAGPAPADHLLWPRALPGQGARPGRLPHLQLGGGAPLRQVRADVETRVLWGSTRGARGASSSARRSLRSARPPGGPHPGAQPGPERIAPGASHGADGAGARLGGRRGAGWATRRPGRARRRAARRRLQRRPRQPSTPRQQGRRATPPSSWRSRRPGAPGAAVAARRPGRMWQCSRPAARQRRRQQTQSLWLLTSDPPGASGRRGQRQQQQQAAAARRVFRCCCRRHTCLALRSSSSSSSSRYSSKSSRGLAWLRAAASASCGCWPGATPARRLPASLAACPGTPRPQRQAPGPRTPPWCCSPRGPGL
jgi:hypothetical protein